MCCPYTWEIWHRCLSHIGYDALNHMCQENLVDGLIIDKSSPILDCIPCIQAKQSVAPFGPPMQQNTSLGELTHIDLWGKYDITSINGSSYYLLMVDNATRYTSIAFLKMKNQAAKKLKNYIMHLKVRWRVPHALHLDKGSEFVNANLRDWCLSNGIKMQTTAPYSPAQNGIAECMNHMLVEIAHAMLIAVQLPKFLWEHTVMHISKKKFILFHLFHLIPYLYLLFWG